MKLNQNITIEQRQELVMTPDLIQSIRILKYNSLELSDYVQEQMKANPVLEYKEQDWQMKIKSGNNFDSEYGNDVKWTPDEQKDTFENYVYAEESLEEHLIMQLELSTKTPETEMIGKYIIQSLDENGYLNLPLKEVAQVTGSDKEKVKKVLALIQTFEPYGVGARSLAECLAIQLNNLGLLNKTYIQLLKEHLEDLSSNRLNKISVDIGCTIGQVQQMADVLRHLDPKPGQQFNKKDDNKYIIPEIYVDEVAGECIAEFNESAVPELIISSYYKSMLLEKKDDPEVMKYLKARIDAGQKTIENIEKRKETIRKTANAIVKYQENFFRYGDKYLKTMSLKNVADEIGMHESTVSRAVTGKYLQCRMGVFELKYFFSEGTKNKDNDPGISSKSIKAHIRDIISREDPFSPESDQKIMDILNGLGIEISRRTVTKYREAMNIPSSVKRKRYR